MGAISTGTPAGFNRYEEMAVGFLQMAVDTFAGTRGVPLRGERFSSGAARKFTLAEDRDEVVQDVASKLHTRLMSILERTELEHNFGYRLLPSGNVLVGLDPQEFDHEPDCNDTPWETTGDF